MAAHQDSDIFTLMFADGSTKDVEYGLLKYFTTIKNSINPNDTSEIIPIATISNGNMITLLEIMKLICDTPIIHIKYEELEQLVEDDFKKLYYKHCNESTEDVSVPLIAYLKDLKLKYITELLNNINFAHNDYMQWALVQYVVEEIKGVPPMDVAKMLEQEYKPLTDEQLADMRKMYPEIDEKFTGHK